MLVEYTLHKLDTLIKNMIMIQQQLARLKPLGLQQLRLGYSLVSYRLSQVGEIVVQHGSSAAVHDNLLVTDIDVQFKQAS